MQRFIGTIVALLLTVALAVPASAELRKVSVSAGSGGMDGAVCIAMAKGYFAENGIEVEHKIYRNGSVALKAFLDGEVDFGTTNRVGIVLSDMDFAKVALLGVLAYTDSQTKVLCRKDAGISSPKDLKGKRIATVRATTAHYYLYKYLLHNGISPKDVSITFLTKKQLPGAIANGEVDAICQHGTPIEKAEAKLGDNAIKFTNAQLDRKTVPILAHRTLVNAEPELIEGMFRALKKAEGWVVGHEEEAARIIADMKHRSYEGTLNFVKNEVEYNLSLKQSLLLNFESVEGWAIENKLVSHMAPRNFMDLIEYQPLEKVFPGSVSIIR